MARTILSPIVIAFPLLGLAHACAPDLEDRLIGTWVSDQFAFDSATVEFVDDSTLILVSGKESLSGNYHLIADNRIRVEFGGLGVLAGPQFWGVSLTDHKLVLTESAGQVDTFTRFEPGRIARDLVGAWSVVQRWIDVENHNELEVTEYPITLTVEKDGSYTVIIEHPDTTIQRSRIGWSNGNTFFSREAGQGGGAISVSTFSIHADSVTFIGVDTLTLSFPEYGERKAVSVATYRRLR